MTNNNSIKLLIRKAEKKIEGMKLNVKEYDLKMKKEILNVEKEISRLKSLLK